MKPLFLGKSIVKVYYNLTRTLLGTAKWVKYQCSLDSYNYASLTEIKNSRSVDVPTVLFLRLYNYYPTMVVVTMNVCTVSLCIIDNDINRDGHVKKKKHFKCIINYWVYFKYSVLYAFLFIYVFAKSCPHSWDLQ